MDYNILRANDIRGEYPEQINKNVAYIIGQAFGTYLHNINVISCIVGHDNRLSSDELHEGLIQGLLETGVNITDLGLVSTPMLNYACIKLENPYAIMITASHNRKEDNGFKIFGETYLHLNQEELQSLYQIIKSDNFVFGAGSKNDYDIMDEYVEMMVSKFPKLNKKVVVDCGNGTPSIVIKKILDKLLYNVNYINCESDGSFPVHNPDPNDEANLQLLKSVVKMNGADLGFGVDGDGDRMGIIDENGSMITTDYLLAIFAHDIIPKNDNKTVIIDVKTSTAVEQEINKVGVAKMIKNGSAYVETITNRDDALLGGEYSGHIFFRDDFFGFDDGIYGSLRFIELVSRRNIRASEVTQGMEKYFSTPEIRIEVTDDNKNLIVEEVKNYCVAKNYKLNLEDGVRVNFDDGFSLIRSSNTGPFLTLRFEAATDEILNERKKEFMTIIDNYLK